MAISFISESEIVAENRLNPLFMYTQLLKDILLNDDRDESKEQARCRMLEFCRTCYMNNKNELKILDEFERDFVPECSIYWYTRECFLYKMLNKALWTPEFYIRYKLRYFLRHLHRQILAAAADLNTSPSPMTVCHGQGMPIKIP